ncbi:MAG: histidine kinase [Rhizobacter sp.]|nr:histidine kinase [Rhizobacter sp.]
MTALPEKAVRRPLLTTALPDLDAWTAWFATTEIPVLASTSETLEALRQNEDAVDANSLGEMIAEDPLMSLKVLAHSAADRPPNRVADPETVTAALVMMGITPFFRDFGLQPTVEDQLREHPYALEGLTAVLRRSHRAALIALAFAVHRMDTDAAVIYEAALLHDLADILLWCHAPGLAQQTAALLAADSTLRSAQAQRATLHIELHDLQRALMKQWHLPELLIHIMDDQDRRDPTARTVLLAIRVARHSAHGWDNAALPDDYADIAALLNLSPESAMEMVQGLDL